VRHAVVRLPVTCLRARSTSRMRSRRAFKQVNGGRRAPAWHAAPAGTRGGRDCCHPQRSTTQ
jgi:hypothetical protein